MAALQSFEAPVTRRPRSSQQRRQKQSRQTRPHDHQWVAAEISVKLVVNGTLSIIAVLTLLKLLPYQMSQQEKLREIRTQVQETEQRVNRFRDDFSESFDPHQIKRVMQENSPLIEPNKRRIFWQ